MIIGIKEHCNGQLESQVVSKHEPEWEFAAGAVLRLSANAVQLLQQQ